MLMLALSVLALDRQGLSSVNQISLCVRFQSKLISDGRLKSVPGSDPDIMTSL